MLRSFRLLNQPAFRMLGWHKSLWSFVFGLKTTVFQMSTVFNLNKSTHYWSLKEVCNFLEWDFQPLSIDLIDWKFIEIVFEHDVWFAESANIWHFKQVFMKFYISIKSNSFWNVKLLSKLACWRQFSVQQNSLKLSSKHCSLIEGSNS